MNTPGARPGDCPTDAEMGASCLNGFKKESSFKQASEYWPFVVLDALHAISAWSGSAVAIPLIKQKSSLASAILHKQMQVAIARSQNTAFIAKLRGVGVGFRDRVAGQLIHVAGRGRIGPGSPRLLGAVQQHGGISKAPRYFAEQLLTEVPLFQ